MATTEYAAALGSMGHLPGKELASHRAACDVTKGKAVKTHSFRRKILNDEKQQGNAEDAGESPGQSRRKQTYSPLYPKRKRRLAGKTFLPCFYS